MTPAEQELMKWYNSEHIRLKEMQAQMQEYIKKLEDTIVEQIKLLRDENSK